MKVMNVVSIRDMTVEFVGLNTQIKLSSTFHSGYLNLDPYLFSRVNTLFWQTMEEPPFWASTNSIKKEMSKMVMRPVKEQKVDSSRSLRKPIMSRRKLASIEHFLSGDYSE